MKEVLTGNSCYHLEPSFKLNVIAMFAPTGSDAVKRLDPINCFQVSL